MKITVHTGNCHGITDITELLTELGISVIYLEGDMKADTDSIPLMYDPNPENPGGSGKHVSANCMGFFHRLDLQHDNRGLVNPYAWTDKNPLSLRILTLPSIRRTYAVLSAIDQRLEWLTNGAFGYPGISHYPTKSRSTKRFLAAIDQNRELYRHLECQRPDGLLERRKHIMRKITARDPERRTRNSVSRYDYTRLST